MAALFHGFNDISSTLENGDSFLNRSNNPIPVSLIGHLFLEAHGMMGFKSTQEESQKTTGKGAEV